MTRSTTTQRQKGEAFRALHARPQTFIIPNPWDPGTARLLAAAGFEALATTSAGYAFSVGRRDGTVTRDEMMEHVGRIVTATDLPVSADLESGFGDDPRVVAETIRLGAERGLVGASIEDLVYAQLHGRAARLHAETSRRSASARRSRKRASCRSRSRSPRGARISSSAIPTSTTRSRACKRTKRPAPTCSTRRERRREPSSRRSSAPSIARSTTSPVSPVCR